jgi:ATP-dependent helicase/nuclease subunit B
VTCRIQRVVPGEHAEAVAVAVIRQLQGASPLAPVWVVVRTALVGESLRRRLAEDGAFAAVRFSPLGALVRQVAGAGPFLDGRQPLSPVALRAAARVALDEAPGLLGPIAGQAATEAALASTYRELRSLRQGDRDRLAGASARARDVVRLLGRMQRLLAARFYDGADMLDAAVTRLEATAGALGPDFAEIGEVVVYLPDPLPPQEITLLASLARHVGVWVLAGRTGDQLADRAVDRFVETLRGAFPYEYVSSPAGAGAASPDRLGVLGAALSAPDDDVEVREAVRLLMAHAEAGGDLGRCIVAFPDGELSRDLGRRVREQLRAAGLPSNGGAPRRLRDVPQGQLLTGLARLSLPAESGHELDRGEVMGWLDRSPIRVGQGITRELGTVKALGSVPVGSWDRCSRAAGVLSGIEAWRYCLGSYIQRLGDAERAMPTLLAAQDLAVFIERLHSLTTAAAAAASWRALHGWADRALVELLESGDVREALAEALGDLDVLDALEPLGHLSANERLRRFVVALDVVLDRPWGDGGRYGVGPTVAPLSAVAGARSDLLCVLGCRQGELPGRRTDDPLIPRSERAHIDDLAWRERADERERRHLVSLLTASTTPQASFGRIDVRAGRLGYPSRWMAELLRGPTTEVPSFASSVRRVATGIVPAADATDFELASLTGSGTRPSPTWLMMLDPDFGRRRESVALRREGGLNPFAGYVPAAGGGSDAWSDTVSPTRLQSFAECPFRFFLERRLRVSVIEAPEQLVQIDARERGTLMHAVLEGFFRPGAEPWTVSTLDEAQLRRLRRLAHEQFQLLETSGKTGKALFWATERSRILRDLERYVARDLANLATERLVPIAVELEFGREGAPFVIKAADRDLRFSGYIDRVDRAPDGRLVVVDYKSGKSDSFKGIATDALGKGRHLQLPIYAKAAQQAFGSATGVTPPVRAEYRFLQATAGYQVVPVELTCELDNELSEVLGTLVSTIDAGCFPPRPGRMDYGQHEYCRYCDFDALCTTDRAELWERAGADPRMKAYVRLVTGPDEVGANGGGST